jgi:AcrR family transcriptional regulator
LRAEQALLTRRRILEIARTRFLETGWAATTMKAVADEASVAPTTVYAVFGSKRALLSALIDEALTGLAEPGNHDWGDAIRHPDQSERARRGPRLVSAAVRVLSHDHGGPTHPPSAHLIPANSA